MSNLQEITDAIDDRLDELKQQIASLEAARRALTEIRSSRPAGRTGSTPAAATRTPAKARRSRATTPRRAAAAGSASTSPSASPTSDRATEPAEVTPPTKPVRRRRSPAQTAAAPTPASAAEPAAKTPPKAGATKSSPRARTTKSSPRARRRELEPGQIEGLLRESEDGLSLVALARRAEVSEAKVADRLSTLERSGEARRSGPRRTSLWRLVSDEERIAERAAELARASRPKT
jgi:hypothetical protein